VIRFRQNQNLASPKNTRSSTAMYFPVIRNLFILTIGNIILAEWLPRSVEVWRSFTDRPNLTQCCKWLVNELPL